MFFSTSLKDRIVSKTIEELSLEQQNPNIAEIFPKEEFNLDFYIISPTHKLYLYIFKHVQR